MQSGYEIDEIHQQQSMADYCSSSVFSINHQQQQQILEQQVHSIPITQQLFQHQQHLFYRLDQQPCLHQHEPAAPGRQTNGNVGGGGASATLPAFFAVNFKLGLNENSDIRDDVVLNDGSEEDVVLHESEHHITDRQPMTSQVKPHCWQNQEDSAIKTPFWCSGDEEKEESPEGNTKKQLKYSEQLQVGNGSDYKFRLFGELEAIYSLAAGGFVQTNQNQTVVSLPAATATSAETSKKAGKKRKHQYYMASFLEKLVKQLMDHQEVVHSKFLDVIERLDQQRKEREEAWRQEEILKLNREVIARAHEQALASSREATILSYLEKITGQTINLLPTRWPKAEVEALIRVRSSLESKFQEPGLKGPLWEEISNSMASIMGYHRSPKRCKEKWENINKYFKKTKETSKHQQSKTTCPYFELLDQLYSKSNASASSSSYCSSKLLLRSDLGVQMKSNSELLDAIIAGSERIGNRDA